MAVDSVQNSLTALFQSKSSKAKSNTDIGMDGFLQLISAQMQNQDMMNPMNDTEMIAQLAQFTMLQSMQDLTLLTTTSYSADLLGKEVTAARLSSTGDLAIKSGTVTGVGLYDGDPVIYIDGESYSLGEIMIVGKPPLEKTVSTD